MSGFLSDVPRTKDRPSLVKRCYSLPAAMTEWIAARAATLGIADAELVRRALDDYRERHDREPRRVT
jgi:hypothetical protein